MRSGLTAIDIIKELLYSEITIQDFVNENFQNPLPGVGKWNMVFTRGDHNNGSCSFERVIEFKDQNIYLQATGYYNSYDGYEYDQSIKGLQEVFPEIKTMTVYTKKSK